VHSDHLDTPRRVSRSSDNTIVWRWNSDPYGTGFVDEDPDGDGQHFVFNLRFPGQYFDVESGLNYNYFRDYDPTTGRYVESDPIGLAGGINTYIYGLDDPVGNSDESGLLVPPPEVVSTVAAILSGRPPKVPGLYACNARCARFRCNVLTLAVLRRSTATELAAIW
jgi:RHS repeat-associated protein